MLVRGLIVTGVTILSAFAGYASDNADDSVITLGRSAFMAHCAVCHGEDAKGGGEFAKLLEVKPSNLTTLSEKADGKYPFSDIYQAIVHGMEAPGHGPSKMPIWGDYFLADALEDRGVGKSDAISIAAGRVLSLAYYLETLQE